MTNDVVSAEDSIRAIVRSHVESYATGFSDRHLREVDDPEGVLNMKIHNVFVSALGPEVQYYSALARSLDSSLGNLLEAMAINIGSLFYDITRHVEGGISKAQVNHISDILESYTRNAKKPEVSDYANSLRTKPAKQEIIHKRKATDYYLHDKEKDTHHLIELKIGGDLDNKKARSEKEAILEQYAILSNSLPKKARITVHFATAYHPEKNEQKIPASILQFYSKDELLIGEEFWNFVCKRPNGHEIVADEYGKSIARLRAFIYVESMCHS
ncbi:MAG: TdeIII family type II restriction endonuclease [Flavobacteriales bacterium]|jgi:hypothetical protein|nr:TdeIII family type II restriction endonuclease [Flavobacteriales bacterium]